MKKLLPSSSRSPVSWVLVIAVVLTAGVSSVEAVHERIISVRGVGKIRIDLPAGYSFETEQNREGITVVKMENPVWRIAISAGIIPERDPEVTTARWQHTRLVGFLADLLAESDADEYKFQPLYPAIGSGQFCVFTEADDFDAQRDPGDYRHLTAGIKTWMGISVIFQIMSNDITSAEYEEVFRIFTDSFEPI